MRAIIMVSQNGSVINYDVPLTIDSQFNGPKYERLRTLEINRLLSEGFTDALNRFDADNPISNDTLVMISFEGLPTQRKE